MSPGADTLQRMRAAVAGCAVLLVVAAGLGVLAWDRAQGLGHLADDERRVRLSHDATIDEMRGQAERLRRFARRHADLERRGLGAFSATHEVDRLERVVRSLALPGGPAIDSYAVRARMPLPESLDIGMTRHSVSMQPLDFDATLPHEDAFMRVWTALDDGLGGLHGIEACALQLDTRDGAAQAVYGADPPHLKVRCTVYWYVLEARPDGAAAGTGPVARSGTEPTAASSAVPMLRADTAAPAALATVPPAVSPFPGRLFFSPAERARIDGAGRATGAPADASAPAPAIAAPLRIDGVVRDADGVATVWIDGAPVTASTAITAGTASTASTDVRATVAPDGLAVRVRRAGEPERELRPGQSSGGPELGPDNRIEVMR